LKGSYVEAGDTGRHCVTEGDVIVHRDYESHLNRFGPHGAEVLVLPFAGNWNEPIFMHPGSVSRGFRQQFGLTPAGFRSAARAQRAVRAVAGSQTPLAEIALTAGFADQAHMGNAVRRLTGLSPTALRRRSWQLSS
jgi:hypothetical protein